MGMDARCAAERNLDRLPLFPPADRTGTLEKDGKKILVLRPMREAGSDSVHWPFFFCPAEPLSCQTQGFPSTDRLP